MVKAPYYLSPVEIELLQDYLSCPSSEIDLHEVKSALFDAMSVLVLGADDPETVYIPRYMRGEGDPSSLSAELEGAMRVRKHVICGQDVPTLLEYLRNVERQYDAFAERMLAVLRGAEIVRISYAKPDGAL